MSGIRLLVPLALLGSGLAAGVMFSTVIGIVPMTLVLSYQDYVQTIQFLWPRYDPFMPIVNGLTVVVDVALALIVPTPEARALFAAAALLLGIVMAISVVKNVPINRYVMSLDPRSCPSDWAERDPRMRWRKWNLLRTLFALSALVGNLAGVAALL